MNSNNNTTSTITSTNDEETPAIMKPSTVENVNAAVNTLQELVEDWTFETHAIEVELENERDDFLKCIESLTRIGVAKRNTKTLIQSCHILQKRGRYYIVHFKELLNLDHNNNHLTVEDMYRRNTIAKLLEDWGLVKIVDSDRMTGFVPTRKLKIIAHREKSEWELTSKYTIGRRTK